MKFIGWILIAMAAVSLARGQEVEAPDPVATADAVDTPTEPESNPDPLYDPKHEFTPADFIEPMAPAEDSESPLEANETPAQPDAYLAAVNQAAQQIEAPDPGAIDPNIATVSDSELWKNALWSLAALIFVLALFAICVYLFSRFVGRSAPLLTGGALGRRIGHIALGSKCSLHFVRTGGRVLVVGVTPASVTLVSEFDATAFDAELSSTSPVGGPKNAPTPVTHFRQHLEANARRLERVDKALIEPSGKKDEDEIDALRGDVERLQRILRESSRDTKD